MVLGVKKLEKYTSFSFVWSKCQEKEGELKRWLALQPREPVFMSRSPYIHSSFLSLFQAFEDSGARAKNISLAIFFARGPLSESWNRLFLPGFIRHKRRTILPCNLRTKDTEQQLKTNWESLKNSKQVAHRKYNQLLYLQFPCPCHLLGYQNPPFLAYVISLVWKWCFLETWGSSSSTVEIKPNSRYYCLDVLKIFGRRIW